ncbi:hypothetical protein [Marinobacterium litorale]|uniref:hypothetical protein n=1 Tax=Marinobacterium litorale TaxID=404770 RepID=UPI00041BDD7A|nr:hypothetical protein [Marinobacterium litorale]
MQKLRTAFLFSLIALTVGCSNLSTTEQVVGVTSAAVNVKYQYENSDLVEVVTATELSKTERTIVSEALAQLERSAAALEKYESDPGSIVISLPAIEIEYARILTAYTDLRVIVIQHEPDYSGEQWAAFSTFDRDIRILDTRFRQLTEAVYVNDALRTALKVADTAIKAAAVL